jgi:hypothetical protein
VVIVRRLPFIANPGIEEMLQRRNALPSALEESSCLIEKNADERRFVSASGVFRIGQIKNAGRRALEDKVIQHEVGTVLNQIWEERDVTLTTGLVAIDLGLLATGGAMHEVGAPLSGIEFHFVRRLR